MYAKVVWAKRYDSMAAGDSDDVAARKLTAAKWCGEKAVAADDLCCRSLGGDQVTVRLQGGVCSSTTTATAILIQAALPIFFKS